MKSLRMVTALVLTLAATELTGGTAQGVGLLSNGSIKRSGESNTYPDNNLPGSGNLTLQGKAFTCGNGTWNIDYDTKSERHKTESKVDRYVKRKKRSFVIGNTNSQENETADQNLGIPLFSKAALSLKHLVLALADKLNNCELVLVYDDHYNNPVALEGVLVMANVRQVST